MQWWIATNWLDQGGTRVLGPFGSRDLALEVRTYVEKVNSPITYYVDSEQT